MEYIGRVHLVPGLLLSLFLLSVCHMFPFHHVPPHLGAMAMEPSDCGLNALKLCVEINLSSFFELSLFLSGILLQLKATMHILQPHSRSLRDTPVVPTQI